jgi:predicted GNAT superfamily acetyltransferase
MMRRFVLPDAPPDHTPVDALRMNHDRPGHASDDAAPTQLADVEPPGVHIRPVTSLAEFRACVALQAEVWGSAYTDAVPASLMQVATKHAGAVVLGAFTNTDELVGFLFGLTGVDGTEIVHWSHMLGVRDAARNHGTGRMLKEAQRDLLARRGVRRISWTFDPLVSKNAWLNLNRLGARVVAYVPDLYGTSTSPLHHGIATDRLIVTIDTRAEPPAADAFEPSPVRLPVLTPEMQHGDVAVDSSAAPPALWIEIPTDLRRVLEHTPTAAVRWRESVRAHFQWALGAGYEVMGIQRDPLLSRSFYLLRHKDDA